MNWGTLLANQRIGKETQYNPEAHRPPWQFDFDRITFSSAFRRLQDKTQVFPLSSSDYIRTRLTHSMEVSTVARSLGGLAAHRVQTKLGGFNPLEVGMILAAATLAHDIGNPPFGHSGEYGIQGWFKDSKAVAPFRAELNKHETSDFENFEGNAQGFRILTKLQMYREQGGMQLTAATLGAFTKYPVQSPPPKGRKYKGKSAKKFGFFQSEKEFFGDVARLTGLRKRQGEQFCWCRHPLAFLVEAADDICYRTVDLEDAFRQNLVSYREVEEIAAMVLGSSEMDRVRSEGEADARVDVIRALMIKSAVDKVAEAFAEKHDEILIGSFDESLLSETVIQPAFDSIEKKLIEQVYNNERVLQVETSGFQVIAGLLEAFVQAVNDAHTVRKKPKNLSPKSKKLLALLPTQFIGPGRVVAGDVYTRIQRVIDYVAGMTDSYALNLYRNISGISVP